MIKCKCEGCERRHPHCHSVCEDYKAFRAEVDKRNEYNREKNLQDQDIVNRVKFNMAVLPRGDRR